MLFDHIAVCITVVISAVVCPMVFNTLTACFILFYNKRWLLKPLLTFVVSYTMPFIVFFLKWGSKQDLGFLVGEHKIVGNFQRRGITTLERNYG